MKMLGTIFGRRNLIGRTNQEIQKNKNKLPIIVGKATAMGDRRQERSRIR